MARQGMSIHPWQNQLSRSYWASLHVPGYRYLLHETIANSLIFQFRVFIVFLNALTTLSYLLLLVGAHQPCAPGTSLMMHHQSQDLSLPSITEKSPLPAIIVTPSSPVHTHDFSIAFLAPAPKPTVRERVTSSINNFTDKSWLIQSRPLRTFLILALLFFVMITTHLITHRFAAYPYPRFESEFSHRQLITDPAVTSRVIQVDANLINVSGGEFKAGIWDWIGFGFRKAWSAGGGVVVEDYVAVGGSVSSLE